VRWALAVAIGLFAAGCGEGGEPAARADATPTPTATATPEGRFDIAYKLPRDVARELHEGDAYELLDEKGEVIARSDFDDTTFYPLVEWLEKRGIDIEDPGELTPVWRSVEAEQDLYLVVVTTDSSVADALDDLRPGKRRLAAVYNRWTEERFPAAGEARADWLRIIRLAVREGDRRNVVIIPILH
jgi:hypothetical protein